VRVVLNILVEPRVGSRNLGETPDGVGASIHMAAATGQDSQADNRWHPWSARASHTRYRHRRTSKRWLFPGNSFASVKFQAQHTIEH
jgi:hypothetical protein